MVKTLELSLLGTVAIIRNGELVSGHIWVKSQALLCYCIEEIFWKVFRRSRRWPLKRGLRRAGVFAALRVDVEW